MAKRKQSENYHCINGNTDIIIAAICGGTIALADNGLLDNKRHISSDKEYLKMVCKKYKGENLYENKPVVVDGNLITAMGIAPLEFTFEIFKKLDVMNENTLNAWFNLFKTKEGKYFYGLMQSMG